MTAGIRSRAALDGFGTCLLLFVVVGSGITAERSATDPGVRLVLHAVAVGAGLTVLVAVFARVSGAHFNPAVTLAFWRRSIVDTRTALAYISAQVMGAGLGVVIATATFEEALSVVDSPSTISPGAVVGELVGTFFLVVLILALVDQDRSAWVPASVGIWVAAMILATPSGGQLNPAVTLARTFTDTYTGVAPTTAGVFVVAQLLAGTAAVSVARHLSGTPELKGT